MITNRQQCDRKYEMVPSVYNNQTTNTLNKLSSYLKKILYNYKCNVKLLGNKYKKAGFCQHTWIEATQAEQSALNGNWTYLTQPSKHW